MTVGGLLLFHGAGGDRDHRLFLALEAHLGLPVARCNFPYRDKGPGRRPPDRMPKLIDSIQTQSAACAIEWGVGPETLVVGGRSMGGRATSMAIADGLPAAGLVLLSYPLHPPGKPENLRIEHLPDVTVPTLLVQGQSDPFGKRPEFDQHFIGLGGPLTQVWLEKTGHDPAEKHDGTILDAVAEFIAAI